MQLTEHRLKVKLHDLCRAVGVNYIAAPGGSQNDGPVYDTTEKFGVGLFGWAFSVLLDRWCIGSRAHHRRAPQPDTSSCDRHDQHQQEQTAFYATQLTSYDTTKSLSWLHPCIEDY